ncbi:hypothetical protein [Flavobacterium ginsengiterrae]|uniref:Endosialidase-like protein n=1 Tax=Flavobacterium ginsengiterrae TaxID=871695 RepID=A0ABP7GUK3_9FLAO
MKKLTSLLFIILSLKTFGQINSPNGNNIFSYNGVADVTFKYPERGSGGRAFVHAPNNILAINYDGDFMGGTTIGKNIHFKDNGNSYIYSNLGIGTSDPATKLQVLGALTLGSESVNANTTKIFLQNPIGKTWAISSGANMVTESSFSIYNWSDNQQIPYFHISSTGNVGIGTYQPNVPLTVYGVSNFFPARIGSGDSRSLEISNTPNSTTFISNQYPVFLKTGSGDQPLILSAARVGIGTANPSSMLTVAGNIASREVKVTVDAGADFVFDRNYDLPTLESVDKFIKENKHLPEIASAEEMKKNGINLSEMNIKLLQKIEEMTLYLIEIKKQNDVLRKDILELKQKK